MSLVILCTVPDLETARKIALALVEERLAACVNIVPGLASVYRWQDKIVEDSELLLVIKSTEEKYRGLEARIQSLHPYSVPEIIALPINQGSKAYLGWIAQSTSED